MKVTEVLVEAAFLLGEREVCEAFETSTFDDDATEVKNALLKCYNTVLHETAVNYLPIRKTISTTGGKINFSSLDYPVLRIAGAYDEQGCETPFKTFPSYVIVPEGKITIVYDVVPEDQTETDDFPYADTRIGKRVFAYGVASEYCLIGGRYSEGVNFERKYREGATSSPPRRNLHTRRRTTWGL